MTLNLQNCSAVVPLLDAYHDDELVGDEKASVELHLRACDSCPQKLTEITKLVSVLKSLPYAPSKIDFADRFEVPTLEVKSNVTAMPLDRIGGGKVGSLKFAKIAAIAASVAVFAGIGGYLFTHGGSSTDVATVPQSDRSTPATNNVQIANNKVNRTLQSEEQPASSLNESTHAVKAHEFVDSSVANHQSVQANTQTKSTPEIKAPVTEVAATDGKAQMENAIASNVSAGSQKASVQGAAHFADGPKHSLVAYYESDPNSIPEELGISTDEDGLYAIKM